MHRPTRGPRDGETVRKADRLQLDVGLEAFRSALPPDTSGLHAAHRSVVACGAAVEFHRAGAHQRTTLMCKAATVQGASERLRQACQVPRWTTVSPAFTSVSPVSTKHQI